MVKLSSFLEEFECQKVYLNQGKHLFYFIFASVASHSKSHSFKFTKIGFIQIKCSIFLFYHPFLPLYSPLEKRLLV